MRMFSRAVSAVLLSAAVVLFLSLILSTHFEAGQQQEPPAGVLAGPAAIPPANANDAPRGEGQRRGRGGGGGRGAPPLGDGPWDLGEGPNRVHVTVVTKGLDHPWAIAFLPDGDMLVTERPGRLRVIRKGLLDPTPITGLPQIRAASLGGLLDIALHPKFAENHLIYFTYSKPGAEEPAKATLAVGRARWDGGSSIADFKDIFIAEPYFGGRGVPQRCCGQGPADGSYGSRLAFDKAGYLYVTSGDRNYGEQSQDPASDIGKILRLKDDGSIPTDNPFVGRTGYRPELYTIGHRNPLGLTFHPVTGDLWSSEFGPRGGDEVNRIQAGKNYGWILITNGNHYNGEDKKLGQNGVPGYEDPILFWVPSINPGNLIFYNGDKFPTWKGNMLLATMTRSLLRATFDANGVPTSQERMLTELNQRFRDVRESSDGFIYLLTDETAGAVLRLEPGK
jgi:glucose/arabinose dehydrogenase